MEAHVRLFSRRSEQSLNDLFGDLAQLLVLGSETLSRTMGMTYRDRIRVAPRLHEHANRAAQLSHRIANRLADSLITPFEADALHDLALTMNDAVDAMEYTAQIMTSRQCPAAPDPLLEAAQLIERACAITVEATWKLQDVRQLDSYYPEMRRLKRHGDGLVLTATTALYERGGAAVDVLFERDLIRAVEDVLVQMEKAGRLADLLRVKAP
jgi:uncharacterized protein Yka (UPF0111/DUF47 family)